MEQGTVGTAPYRWTDYLQGMVSAYANEQADRQTHVNAALEWAQHLIKETGGIRVMEGESIRLRAVHQITLVAHPVELAAWHLGEYPLYRQPTFVDQIQQETGCTATIFQRIDAGYLRIATNVPRIDGSPAVGTYIPQESIVAEHINDGMTYKGRALVVDQWYTTAYAPIYLAGEVQGIIYVGKPEVDDWALSPERLNEDAALLEHLCQFYEGHSHAVHDMVQSLSLFFNQHDTLRQRHHLIELGLREFLTLLLQARTYNMLREAGENDPSDRLQAYVRANLAQTLNVEDLADLLCMSQSSLYRLFKERWGHSPGEFILRERLTRAAELLSEGKTSIKEVGYEVGFSSPSYFIKRFKQQYGLTPKEYQEQ